jgi:hypothetical protein
MISKIPVRGRIGHRLETLDQGFIGRAVASLGRLDQLSYVWHILAPLQKNRLSTREVPKTTTKVPDDTINNTPTW